MDRRTYTIVSPDSVSPITPKDSEDLFEDSGIKSIYVHYILQEALAIYNSILRIPGVDLVLAHTELKTRIRNALDWLDEHYSILESFLKRVDYNHDSWSRFGMEGTAKQMLQWLSEAAKSIDENLGDAIVLIREVETKGAKVRLILL
jgi:hypothetical protein